MADLHEYRPRGDPAVTTFDTNGPEMHDALDDLDPGEVSLVRNEFGRFKARALKAIRPPSPSTPNTKE